MNRNPPKSSRSPAPGLNCSRGLPVDTLLHGNKRSIITLPRKDLLDLTLRAAKNTGTEDCYHHLRSVYADFPAHTITVRMPAKPGDRNRWARSLMNEIRASNPDVKSDCAALGNAVLRQIFQLSLMTRRSDEVDIARSTLSGRNRVTLYCTPAFAAVVSGADIIGMTEIRAAAPASEGPFPGPGMAPSR